MLYNKLIVGCIYGIIVGYSYCITSEFWYGAKVYLFVSDVFLYSSIVLWAGTFASACLTEKIHFKLVLKIAGGLHMLAYIAWFLAGFLSLSIMQESVLTTFTFMIMPTAAFLCSIALRNPSVMNKTAMLLKDNAKRTRIGFRVILSIYLISLVLQWFPYGIIKDQLWLNSDEVIEW